MLEQEGYDLVGAAFEVYNELGAGFLEEVYQESLEIEFGSRGIPFESQVLLPIAYKQHRLRKRYVADLLVFGQIVVELKAAKQLAPEHEAQLLNYLKATGYHIGYLLNFGDTAKLEWKRMAL